jgi:hypothetical protein
MPITVTCPTCGVLLAAPDNLAGGQVRCPQCQATITVPGDAALAPAIPVQAPSAAAFKTCPFCGEQVLEVAKKCKHCGETIDLLLRELEQTKKAAKGRPGTPMVFMNAGGGGGGGASSSSAAASAASGRAAEPEVVYFEAPQKRSPWLWVLLGLVAVPFLCCTWFSCMSALLGVGVGNTRPAEKGKVDPPSLEKKAP